MIIRTVLLPLLLCSLAWCGSAAATQTPEQPMPTGPQAIKVQGSELTGLNAGSLTDTLRQAHERGMRAVILDLGDVTRMTEAGMDALLAGVKLFGAERFAVAGLSGDAAALAQTHGNIILYPSVEAARSGLGK